MADHKSYPELPPEFLVFRDSYGQALRLAVWRALVRSHGFGRTAGQISKLTFEALRSGPPFPSPVGKSTTRRILEEMAKEGFVRSELSHGAYYWWVALRGEDARLLLPSVAERRLSDCDYPDQRRAVTRTIIREIANGSPYSTALARVALGLKFD